MRRLAGGALAATFLALALPAATSPQIVLTDAGGQGTTGCLGEIAAPGLPTLAPRSGGALGAGSYAYVVTAVKRGETPPSPAASIITTASAPGAVVVSWSPVQGATAYNIYGRTAGSETLLASVTGTTYTDDGTTKPAADKPPPAENTTHDPCADVLVASSGAESVTVGRPLSLLIDVENHGPDATFVVLKDTLPSGATFLADRSDPCWSTNPSTGELECNLFLPFPGGVTFVDISFTRASPGPSSNVVSVKPPSGIADPDADNNTFRTPLETLEPQTGTTFTVNTSDDHADEAGCTVEDCTLREAIEAANRAPGSSIHFDIGDASKTILVSDGPLPLITAPTVIDATTQPKYAGTPLVTLEQGFDGPSGALTLVGGGSEVRGFDILDWLAGIIIRGQDGNTVAANYIGVNADDRVGSGEGIWIDATSDGNTIGGTSPADRNVISLNDDGIEIDGNGSNGPHSSDNNVVTGNYIGLNPDGSAVPFDPDGGGDGSGNYLEGILLFGSNNTIGGTSAGARNYISANGDVGIDIGGSGNIVDGNTIGLAATSGAAGNSTDGILVEPLDAAGPANVIGDTTGGGNIISGNQANGVHVIGPSTDVGSPTRAAAPAEPGTTVIAGNTITNNGDAGVAVDNPELPTVVTQNSIDSNGGLGIDLGTTGVRPNDTGDGDGFQNSPVFADVAPNGASTTVDGNVPGAPGGRTVELFSVPACDPSGFGEGRTFLPGSTTTTKSDGRFDTTVPDGTGAISATATGPDGTSEFSACVEIPRADLAITKTVVTSGNTVGQAATFRISVVNHGPADALGVTVDDPLPSSLTLLSATTSQGSCGGSVSCDLGTLSSGHSATITVVATLSAPGQVCNTATVNLASATFPPVGTAPQAAVSPFDPDASNNVASACVEVTNADLSITKTAAPNPAAVGESLTYTLTVHNGGATHADAVSVTDPLPNSVTPVAVTPSQGTCTLGATVSCALGSLDVGTDATISIVVTPTTAGSITNTATVSSPTNDPNPANNTASTTTSVTSADLAITKTAAPEPVTVGQNLTYSLAIHDSGPTAADAVSVADPLPAGTTPVSATSSQGTCTLGATVACDLGSLAAGANATVTVVVTPTAPGTITNTASVSSPTHDADQSNNHASASTTVTSADLSIAKTAAPDPVTVGQNVTYTLTVHDNGPSAADAVRVTDPLPAAVTPIAAVPSQGTCTLAPTVTCDLGSLAAGADATVQIVAGATSAGTLTNTANVSSPTHDPNGDNNHASASTAVTSADLSIAKAAAPELVTVGDRVTYTLTVRNAGPTASRGASVQDRLPSEVTLVSATVSQGDCTGSPQVSCALGPLAEGATATVTLVVDARRPGTIRNTATVAGQDFDPDRGDNSATALVDVTSADLSITKAANPDEVLVGNRLTYTLTVRNGGPTAARNVRVEDDLPAGQTFVSATPSQGTCVGTTTIACDLGTLPDGGEATVVVVVEPHDAGDFTNTGKASSDDYDPDPVNDSSSATVAVEKPVVEVPRPKLIVEPALGPPGFVTTATGTDFPPNARVLLTWSRGLGSRVVTTDARGTFRVHVLVFDHDLLGSRDLVAQDAGASKPRYEPRTAPFLVVVPTIEAPDFIIRR